MLVFGATEITLPTFARDALRFALDGPPFIVRDLPGQLDDVGKVVLVRRLLREGLLVTTGRSAGVAEAASPFVLRFFARRH